MIERVVERRWTKRSRHRYSGKLVFLFRHCITRFMRMVLTCSVCLITLRMVGEDSLMMTAANAINSLGLDLLTKMPAQTNNTLLSPYSIQMGFGMLFGG